MHLDPWTIALQTINFAVLAWLLHRFLYAPVLRLIDARQAAVGRQFEAARAAEDAATADRAAAEAARAGIAAERDAALKVAADAAQATAAQRRAQAERDADALLDGARKTLATEREHALDEARRLALELGADVARRLLDQVPIGLRAEAWLDRIERHLAALPAPERTTLAGGGAVTVVTTTALPDASAEQWRQRLRLSLGDGLAVDFATDPALVAGAELHFPTALLRFSWQDALAALRGEVVANAHPR